MKDELDHSTRPESDKVTDPPPRLHIYTKEFGETTSHTRPGIDADIQIIEGYTLEVPDEVTAICKKIRGLGGRAFLVGGCVRDSVINHEIDGADLHPKDFDLEVYGLEPDLLQAVLGSRFGTIDSVGKAFGVLKASIDSWEEPLDFAIPRRESNTGVGHKDFAITGDPTMTIAEAAKRRDLTLNSLAYDPLTSQVFDAFGGVEDIKNRQIDITDERTFIEDPLRVMRVMQFAARFDFAVTDQTRTLCRTMVDRGDLDSLPRERVTDELRKLLSKSPKPSVGLQLAREIGLTERYWPELHALIDVPQEPKWHPEGDVWVHTLQVVDAAALIAKREKLTTDDKLTLILSALCHDLGKPATTKFEDGAWRARGHEEAGVEPSRNFLKRFTFPETTVSKILALVPDHLKPVKFYASEVDEGINMDRALRRLALKLSTGGTNLQMLELLVEADHRGRNGADTTPKSESETVSAMAKCAWLRAKSVELVIESAAPKNLIAGRELTVSGIPGGIWVGCVLKALYCDQLDGIVSTHDEALAKALDYYQQFIHANEDAATESGKNQNDIWTQWARLDDPRIVLTEQ